MDNLFELVIAAGERRELRRVMDCNGKTGRFGLSLSEQEARELMVCRRDSLRNNGRVEFGEGILPKLIFAFCDSGYINQENYSAVLAQLQEIFYRFKNESFDELTDDELVEFMRREYEEVCFGDLDYLAGTCLERFSRHVRFGCLDRGGRAGDEYSAGQKEREHGDFSEETRWDAEVYRAKLDDLF